MEYLHKFMELSRNALYEVDTDEKKQDSFVHDLDPELRTLIEDSVYLDFNTIINKAITTAKNKQDEMRDKKRKFEAKKMYSQEKTLKLHQGLVSGSDRVLPAVHHPREYSGIFSEATYRRKSSEQPEDMLQL
jgi:Zn-dependent M32 family carboxypeptidase